MVCGGFLSVEGSDESNESGTSCFFFFILFLYIVSISRICVIVTVCMEARFLVRIHIWLQFDCELIGYNEKCECL